MSIAHPPRQVQAWYGLSGEIEVENDLWHLVKVGGVPLNHPPVVNLILRRRLPRRDKLRLSYMHEFGHFQTLPVALAHVVLLLVWSGRRQRSSAGWISWAAALAVAHQAVWELAAETYVVTRDRAAYQEIYRRTPNRLLPTFWIVVSGLGLGLSCWLLRSK
jgi:hypothetical protein